ncbi:hypothetical protein [Larsenimonas rhizosphaerae]|uniref:hypothetical protein n=1 Tax=Larsenimonas rhizosphaerae TaxID=2944682 RepID=UPI0020347F6A|nr:hypothetical protein [Larsenimonas rhizosphaerae]MCM2132232.1 hypothetical protein [Larsenimonas rhizosphaerae]
MSEGLTMIVGFLGVLALSGFVVCGWVLYSEHQHKKKAAERKATRVLENTL